MCIHVSSGSSLFSILKEKAGGSTGEPSPGRTPLKLSKRLSAVGTLLSLYLNYNSLMTQSSLGSVEATPSSSTIRPSFLGKMEGVVEGEEKSTNSVDEASEHRAPTNGVDSSDEESSNLKPRKTHSRRPSIPLMVFAHRI